MRSILLRETGFSAVLSPMDSLRRTLRGTPYGAYGGRLPQGMLRITAKPATFPKGRSGQIAMPQAELLPVKRQKFKYSRKFPELQAITD